MAKKDNNENINNEENNQPGLNEIVLSETSGHSGICKYCNQVQLFEAPDGLSDLAYNDIASDKCDCAGAKAARKKKERFKAAGLWARDKFSQEDGQLQLVLCSINATFNGEVDAVSIKIGKHTHKVDTDKDGMIRIKTTFRESNEEKF